MAGSIEALMFSLFGWTPSLRRMLRGKVLPCGCSVGVYETRSGEVVHIIDARSSSCEFVAHSVDTVLAGDDANRDEPALHREYSQSASP